MSYDHATTRGAVTWDDRAIEVEDVDDPIEPDGGGWELCGSALGELRHSKQLILWFWRRDSEYGRAYVSEGR